MSDDITLRQSRADPPMPDIGYHGKAGVNRYDSKRPAQHPQGWVCEEDGCETRLSMYNPGPMCRLHQPFKGLGGPGTEGVRPVGKRVA